MGADDRQQEVFRDMLAEDDPCFGKAFDEKSSTCEQCTAPVVVGGEIHLLRDVCKSVCEGDDEVYRLNRLTSSDVFDRLSSGASVEEIFYEILDGAPIDQVGREARQLLYNRLYYLENKKGFPTPDVPSLSSLKEGLDE